MQTLQNLLGLMLAIVGGSIALAVETSNAATRSLDTIRLAQAAAPTTSAPTQSFAPGSDLRGSTGSSTRAGDFGRGTPFENPSATPGLNDEDLSRRLAPSSSPRSLSQFASANRSSSTFRPTNIFGDFFGGQNSPKTIQIPVVYTGVQGNQATSSNFIGFFLTPGSNVPDLFANANGNPNLGDPNTKLVVSEPLNQSNAYVPSNDGVNRFTYDTGTATFNNLDNTFDITYFYKTTDAIPSSPSALYGRQKIAENVSPIPQNRIFLNYSYFDNTPLAGGLDVKRWTPGFESLLWSEATSLEVRLPMATTLSSNIFSDGTDSTHNEVGNLYFAIKHLIYREEQSAVSIGCSATLPTADDINYFVRSRAFGLRQLLRIENQAVHVLPFIGWYQGGSRFFTQGFAQLDIDTNGNRVSYNPNFLQDRLVTLGRTQDSNFFYFDIQNGYWLMRKNPNDTTRGCTGISAVSELHWNRSLNAEDQLVFPNGSQFSAPRSDVQILNGLLGMNFVYNHKTSLSFGYTAPIGNGSDHEFKGEGRFIFNRYF